VALIASTLGLSALAQSAEAATKKYTVCKTTDVKLGSAKLFEVAPNKPVLITQPKKGVFRAFSVYCTHSGAVIGLVQGSNLVCQVHGAKFDSTTGAVKQGPATKALTRYTCTVSAGKVIVTL
jgi:nitrite reductase/ring-hydroxylating ferredoxin subunit